MNLDSDKWYGKLNDYVYGYGYSEQHANFCVYFWKTILAFILAPIAWIVNHIPSVDFPSISERTQVNIAKTMLVCFCFFILASALWFGHTEGWNKLLLVIVAFGIVIGGLTGIVFGIFWLIDKYNDWRCRHPKKDKPYKKKEPNMVLTFVKAKKNKHCPRINWK